MSRRFADHTEQEGQGSFSCRSGGIAAIGCAARVSALRCVARPTFRGPAGRSRQTRQPSPGRAVRRTPYRGNGREPRIWAACLAGVDAAESPDVVIERRGVSPYDTDEPRAPSGIPPGGVRSPGARLVVCDGAGGDIVCGRRRPPRLYPLHRGAVQRPFVEERGAGSERQGENAREKWLHREFEGTAGNAVIAGPGEFPSSDHGVTGNLSPA